MREIVEREPLLSFISDFEKIVHWPPLFSIQYYARIDFYFVFALVSAAECFWTFKESRGWPGRFVHKAGRQAAAAAGLSPIYNMGPKSFSSRIWIFVTSQYGCYTYVRQTPQIGLLFKKQEFSVCLDVKKNKIWMPQFYLHKIWTSFRCLSWLIHK